MKPLNLHGEYWFTDTRALLCATDGGDYNHEGHVMEHIITAFCDALGMENEFQTDAVWFRTVIWDEVNPSDATEEIDALDTAEAKLIASGTSPEEVADMRTLVGGGNMDAREFAIKHWGWIRIAGATVECKDLTPRTLKRVHDAISAAYEEETDDALPLGRSIDISQYRGLIYEVSLAALERGKLKRKDTRINVLSQAARAQIRKMDLAAQPACYGTTIGG